MRPPIVPFLDLSRAQKPLSSEFDDAWKRVVETSLYVGGPVVEEFEREWAVTCGVSHAVGVGNGTDALELALRALGIGRGDEVIVPANTFIATAEAVVAVGAVPHFVDVDPQTLLLDADAVADGLTENTAAVIVVHLYGQAADMTSITEVARRAGIAVVEDCAQAHGATWEGRPVGSFGAIGCTSFYPGKNLGAFGDAGAVFTHSGELAHRVRQLADHGRASESKYEHPVVGRNSRLDAVQAAVLAVKLPHLSTWNEQRRTAAARYAERLNGTPEVTCTPQDVRSLSVHHLHVVRVGSRDDVRKSLAEAGVHTGVHYPVPCHRQRDYASFPHGDLTVSEAAAHRLLSLPMFPGITAQEIDQVCTALKDAVVRRPAIVG